MTGRTKADEGESPLLERALRAERALEEVTAQRNRLWNERHESQAAKAEAQYYRTVIAEMQGSRSWRYTALVRKLRAAGLSRQWLPWPFGPRGGR